MIETYMQALPHGITLSCRATGERGLPRSRVERSPLRSRAERSPLRS